MSRWNPLRRLVISALLLVPVASFAYEIEQPQTMDDVLRVFSEEIPDELQRMQCGGWVGGVNVGDTPGDGFITYVDGVPGRDSLPLEDIGSGMGVRIDTGGNGEFDDGYIFPENALGLSTRCPTETDLLPKIHWSYDRPTWIDRRDVENLYFEDPPCVWRPGPMIKSPHSPENCQEFCDILNGKDGALRYQYPDCAKIVGGVGPLEPNDEDHLELIDPADPDLGFQEREDKQELTCALWCFKNSCTDGWTDFCDPSLKNLTSLVWGPDNAMEDAPSQPGGLPDSPTPEERDPDGDGTISIESQHPNCVVCEGQECQCGYQDVIELQKRGDYREDVPSCQLKVPEEDIGVPTDLSELSEYSKKVVLGCRLMAIGQLLNEQEINLDIEGCANLFDSLVGGGDPEEAYKDVGVNLMPGNYASFFRQYEAAYTRAPLVEVAPDDDNENVIDVACYGFYRQIDHRTKRIVDKPAEELDGGDTPMDNRYRRCVINMDVAGRLQTQAGKGEYGQNTQILTDDDPIAEENDAWVSIIRGFSMMNPERTRGVADALLRLDAGGQRAVFPVGRFGDEGIEEFDRALGATTRAFDDTGRARGLVTWWQGLQQQVLTSVATPATLHVLLPPSWAYGLDPPETQTEDDGDAEETADRGSQDAQERRMEPVDVQIGAVSGALDEIVETLEEGLLFRLEQRRIPVVVFSASPEQLRDAAAAICLRAMQRTGQLTCDGALTGEEQRVRSGLLAYAEAAYETRLLRLDLASYATELTTAQNGMLEPIRAWLDENRELYEDFVARREDVLAVAREWDEVEAEMAIFPNMPWCMEQRFTPQIFSNLDPALESRKALPGPEAPDTDPPWEMPGIPNIPQSTDAVVDLSMLRLQPTKIPVPVFEPVIWQLDLTDFAPGKKTYPKMAPAPSMDRMRAALREARSALPRVCTPLASMPGCVTQNPPAMEVPDLPSPEMLDFISNSIQNVKIKIAEISVTYGRFWQSVGPLYPPDPEVQENADGTYTLLIDGAPAPGNLSWWLRRGGGGWTDVDAMVAALKPVISCLYWNTLPCGFTENDLRETIARLNSRPMAELEEDRQSIATVRILPSGCLANDEVCRMLPAESRPRPTGWQVLPADVEDTREDISAIGERLRALQLPAPLGEEPLENIPPYDTSIDDTTNLLPPALFAPEEEPLRPASSPSSLFTP